MEEENANEVGEICSFRGSSCDKDKESSENELLKSFV